MESACCRQTLHSRPPCGCCMRKKGTMWSSQAGRLLSSRWLPKGPMDEPCLALRATYARSGASGHGKPDGNASYGGLIGTSCGGLGPLGRRDPSVATTGRVRRGPHRHRDRFGRRMERLFEGTRHFVQEVTNAIGDSLAKGFFNVFALGHSTPWLSSSRSLEISMGSVTVVSTWEGAVGFALRQQGQGHPGRGTGRRGGV